MDIEKLLYLNFSSLKEFSSSESLGINNKGIYVCKIPYFEENYYLVVNPKREYIKVIFKDNDNIEFNSRVFVSKKEVSLINILIDSQYHNGSLNNSIVTLSTLENREKLYVKYDFKIANQELVDNYFQSEGLIKKDELKNYLFKLKIDDKLANHIIDADEDRVKFIIGDRFYYSLSRSKFSDGYLFTNHLKLALHAISKVLSEKEGLAPRLLNLSKIEFGNNALKLQTYIQRCIVTSKVDDVNKQLQQILSSLGIE